MQTHRCSTHDSRHKRNKIRYPLGYHMGNVFIYGLITILAVICLVPLLNVLAVSFSSNRAAAAGEVGLWPVEFTTSSYQYAFTKPQFLTSFLVSLKRAALGLVINMTLTVLCAYPLSMTKQEFRWRDRYVWFFFITMIFSGGLIPLYAVVRQTGIYNTIWALVLPGAVPVFNVIILLNFFRQMPKELRESAMIDGANEFVILRKILLPLCLPSIAALSLFIVVGHWNAWLDGLIYMRSPRDYPLQTYLRSLLVTQDMKTMASMGQAELKMLQEISDRTLKSAQIFIASIPVLAAYPFVQKYFMKGLVIGGVKG